MVALLIQIKGQSMKKMKQNNSKQTLEGIWNKGFAKLLLEAMAEGVFTLDREGKITSWNPSMEKITGYKNSYAIGQKCNILNFSH